jgi:hypothetical protein
MGGTVSIGNYESAKAEVNVVLSLSESEQSEFGLVWMQEKKKLKELLVEALEDAKEASKSGALQKFQKAVEDSK